MKFDATQWSEVKPNEKTVVQKGVLRVLASAPAPLYVQTVDYEALVSYGTSWDIEIGTEVTFHVAAAKDVRVFYFAPLNAVQESDQGEVFTNIDRLPDESGNVLEVRKALRSLEIMRRQTLREIQEAAVRLPPRVAPAAASALIEDEAEPK